MQAYVVIRKSDMKPVLECWSRELTDKTLKPEFLALPTVQWLQSFNSAVKAANGSQPTADQIRAELPF